MTKTLPFACAFIGSGSFALALFILLYAGLVPLNLCFFVLAFAMGYAYFASEWWARVIGFTCAGLLGLASLSTAASVTYPTFPTLLTNPNTFPFSTVAIEDLSVQKFQSGNPDFDAFVFEFGLESRRLARGWFSPAHFKLQPENSDYTFSVQGEVAGYETQCSADTLPRLGRVDCVIVIVVPKEYSAETGQLIFDNSQYRSRHRVDLWG